MKGIVALLVAVCVAVVAAVVLGLMTGRLTPLIAMMSLACGGGSAVYVWATFCPSTDRKQKPRVLEWFVIVCFALFALRAFCWLLFVDGDDLSMLSPNNYSDLPLHLTLINYLARGASFWPDNPLYSGEKLHYPVGTDLFNALLNLIGVDQISGLVSVGLVASVITGVALYRWGKGFAVAGFLFNGGLTGFSFFSDLWDNGREFLHTGHFALTLSDYQGDMAWKNIALAMFVTQRGLLYAIPAGLVLLSSWRERWMAAGSSDSTLPLPIEVLLFSTMPLFNVHAFIWFSALLGCWLVIGSHRLRLHVVSLLAASFIPATLCVVLVTGLFTPTGPVRHMIHFRPGWLQDVDEGFFEFWIGNFGVLPFCAVALIALTFWRFEFRFAPRAGNKWRVSTLRIGFVKRDWRLDAVRTTAAFVIPSILLFLLFCFVMFAPWEWDNTKLMIWSYLAVLPFLWDIVVRPLPRIGAMGLCALLFFSGFVSLWGGLDQSHTGYPIADRQELDGVRQATKNLPVEEVFAAYPAYNHPLLLNGCKLVEGFEGHLDSHGIDYLPRLRQLQSLMLGQSGWREIARNLHVRYLFWGEREQEHYPESPMPWRQQCKLIADGPWGAIYDLEQPDPGARNLLAIPSPAAPQSGSCRTKAGASSFPWLLRKDVLSTP